VRRHALELVREDGVQPVVLPRVDSQRAELVDVPGFVVPERAIDGWLEYGK